MRALIKLTIIAAVAGALVLGWNWFRYQDFITRWLNVGTEGVYFEITPGAPLKKVARDLEQEGIISDAVLFVWMAKIKGVTEKVRAGEYFVEPRSTPPQLLEKMVTGKIYLHELTVVEGWTFRQMMEQIRAHDAIEHTLDGLDDSAIMARLGFANEHPEGRFYPETYYFPRGMTDVAFLQRASNAMSERLTLEWQKRSPGLPLKSPYEALILASIVEKETAVESERSQIAGVFIRRLKKKMLLQTDPTVIYGLGEKFDGDLRSRDLKQDTPYNTYTRKGLPPTPIAMPGGDAIHAALHPDSGKALYFVSKGDGSHHFSDTLEEHNKAVIEYQLKGKKK